MAEKSGFAIQTKIMAEVEYVNEEEEVVEQYNDEDVISMESREATPPPPAPPADGDRQRELRQPEAPPVCTIHSMPVCSYHF